MRKIQLTVIQIDNYGPWTVTPKPKPEAELQRLQAELFAKVQGEMASRGGLVFPARFDNLIAVSNGISIEEHREIQRSINEKFPITVSIGIGADSTPYGAQVLATSALQREGGSRSPERVGKLAGECVSGPDEDWVQIAHMDVNHSAALTDSEPLYDTYMLFQKAYLALMDSLRKRNALVFYMGGDNFMALSNGLGPHEIEKVFSEVEAEAGVGFKAGVGAGPTAEVAARLASEGLHEIREGKTKGKVVFKEAY